MLKRPHNFNLATGKITHFEMKITKTMSFFSGVALRGFVLIDVSVKYIGAIIRSQEDSS